jgi:glyceraldehyde 3-phosphate dehydrogenase
VAAWELRRATPADIAPLVALERRSFDWPWGRLSFEGELSAPGADSRVAWALKAHGEERIVGYIFFRFIADEAHIFRVAVDPAWRRCGLGARLVAECLDAARARGLAAVVLEARASNTEAIAWYRKFGFMEVARRRGYYSDRHEDALILKLTFAQGGSMAVKIGINGFGRIGRLLFRAAEKNPKVQVVAINDLTNAETMAHLLKYDSVHGAMDVPVTAKSDAIEVGGRAVAIRSVRDPEKIDWKALGVDIVAECTGLFTKREDAAKHLTGGARKVIISAPATNPDITIVMGVNSHRYDPKQHHIVSNASCTTNCLAPVAKVLHENFKIKRGLMTTVHSYTGDQRLLDFPHKDLRRARSAALSMVPTTTGAAKAVGLVLPELAGKLNGLAVRVPTPNVSLVDLVVSIDKSGVTVSEVNAALKQASEEALKGILGYSEAPLVSSDFNGCALSSIVDAPTTYVIDDMVKVLSWYDNETGYSTRMVDLAAMIGEQL